jgi:two-component system CheB/CheR fusion protein
MKSKKHSKKKTDQFRTDDKMSVRKLAARCPDTELMPIKFSKTDIHQLHTIQDLMRRKKGIDFLNYKPATVNRRIIHRMTINRLQHLEEYAALLKEDNTEANALCQNLLIGVTSFFRDPHTNEAIMQILPGFFANRKPTDPLRIWVPGCSTGEEAISIAIIVREYLDKKGIAFPVKIFATDINEEAIRKAKNCIYPKSISENLSPGRLKKFFIKCEGGFKVAKEIRETCIFAKHNLLIDPPFSKLDLVSCQNVLIYLKTAAQAKVLHVFNYALKPGGYLLLGKSETIGNSQALFDVVNKQCKLYTALPVNKVYPLSFPVQHYTEVSDNEYLDISQVKENDLEEQVDKLLLSRFMPASLLVNKDLDILRFRGPTSKFIEPASGKASLHLLKIIRPELLFDLRLLIQHVKQSGLADLKKINADDNRQITLEVIPIKANDNGLFYIIIFNELLLPAAVLQEENTEKNETRSVKRIKSLETELKKAQDTARILSEDFESSKMELQAANEEVLSFNEELQSINEELETSAHELQSANDELQQRCDELKYAARYAAAVIDLMPATVVLMHDLTIKTANKEFYRTFNLTEEETEGVYLYQLQNGEWDILALKKELKRLQDTDNAVTNLELTNTFAATGTKTISIDAQKLPLPGIADEMILLSIRIPGQTYAAVSTHNDRHLKNNNG